LEDLQDESLDEKYKKKCEDELLACYLSAFEELRNKRQHLETAHRCAVSADISEELTQLLRETDGQVEVLTKEFDAFDFVSEFPADLFPFEAKKSTKFVRPLENDQLICFASIARRVISKSDEFLFLYHDALASQRPDSTALNKLLEEVEKEAHAEFQSEIRMRQSHRDPPDLGGFQKIIDVKAAGPDYVCPVERPKFYFLWSVPKNGCNQQSTQHKLEALPVHISTKISSNLLKSPRESPLRDVPQYPNIIFDKSTKVQLGGVELQRHSPLVFWSARTIESVLSDVHIRCATGAHFELVNGSYERTSEICGGYPVYKKSNDSSICIEHRNGNWEVKPTSASGCDECWASVDGNCALPDCNSRVWRVKTELDFQNQPDVQLVRLAPFTDLHPKVCDLLEEKRLDDCISCSLFGCSPDDKWEVNFQSMVARKCEPIFHHPTIELRRQEIAWFFCELRDWKHVQEDEMAAAEEWFRQNCQPPEKEIRRGTSGELNYFLEKDQDSMYIRQAQTKRRLLFRQVVSSVRGEVLLCCSKWPLQLAKNVIAVEQCSEQPDPKELMESLLQSSVKVNSRLVRHSASGCACDSKSNFLECFQACTDDICSSLFQAVTFFQYHFHRHLLREKPPASDGFIKHNKPYESCAMHTPRVTQPSGADDVDDSDDDDDDDQRHTSRSTASHVSTCCIPENICTWAMELQKSHLLHKPAWKNALVSRWVSQDGHLHIAKLFCKGKPNGCVKNLNTFDSTNMINVLNYCKLDGLSSEEFRNKCNQTRTIRNFVCHAEVDKGHVLECRTFRLNMNGLNSFLEELLLSVLRKVSTFPNELDLFRTRLVQKLANRTPSTLSEVGSLIESLRSSIFQLQEPQNDENASDAAKQQYLTMLGTYHHERNTLTKSLCDASEHQTLLKVRALIDRARMSQ
jgi:hypothetical protein